MCKLGGSTSIFIAFLYINEHYKQVWQEYIGLVALGGTDCNNRVPVLAFVLKHVLWRFCVLLILLHSSTSVCPARVWPQS